MSSQNKLDEPHITINGYLLTPAQSMTMRVALQSFLTTLKNEGLGNDETGKSITVNYLARGAEINKIMIGQL